MKSSSLISEIIQAHGGRDRWQAVGRIDASFSSGGLAFSMHMQPSALMNLQISVHPHDRRVVLKHFCHEGWTGVWEPNLVQVKDASDATVLCRNSPRDQFARFVKNVRWDKLDILYFAGYALWNYLSFPFILDLPGVSVQRIVNTGDPDVLRLDTRFEADFPTHSANQSFLVDASRHLLRHDYTADVIGSWATAGNCCLASEDVDGLRLYTRRKVFPCMRHKLVLPFPTLVWIEIDDIKVINRQAAQS